MGDFNLSTTYNIFWMILLFVSKIFCNMLVFKIFYEDFMLNQHSKSVTKPNFELQLHLALQQYIWSASAFYTKKDSYANYFSYCTLESCIAFMGAELWQLPWRVVFGRFCGFLLVMSGDTLVSVQNPPKRTLYGNCHSSAPMIAALVCKVPYEQ